MKAEIGQDIEKAKELLEHGEVVAIPTETVYGLAANALNTDAVGQIFKVKNRPSFDPLIIHLHSKEQLENLCHSIPKEFHILYEAFCPGPITFILPKKELVPDLVTAGHNSVGIRFPNHFLSRELLERSKLALAAPSANPFGYVSPTSAAHVFNQLGAKIPYILDGGECTVGLESTIIDLSKREIEILRLGGLSLERINEVLGFEVKRIRTSSSNPNAPGMLSSHYSPSKTILFGNIEDELGRFESLEKVGSIVFNKPRPEIDEDRQWILSPSGDLAEAAKNLFRCLRETENTDFEYILAEEFPDEGLGRAINDRLKRAASRSISTS